jgi:hypothetical protein
MIINTKLLKKQYQRHNYPCTNGKKYNNPIVLEALYHVATRNALTVMLTQIEEWTLKTLLDVIP